MFKTPAERWPEAEGLAATLTAQAQTIAALLVPPFTTTRRAKVLEAFGAVELEFGQLSRLISQTLPQLVPQDHRYQTLYRGLSQQLAQWHEARVIFAAMVPIKNRKSSNEVERQPLLQAYARSFETLHEHFCRQAAARKAVDWDQPFHRDIALPFTRFLDYALLARRMARAIGKEGPLHFMDVGCGVGLKLLQAASLYEQVSGLEVEPHRAEAAAEWLWRTAEVITGDAATFERYGDFDVIYAYKPLPTEELMAQTEDNIVAQARPGAILIMPYVDFHRRHTELGCMQVRDAVYVAKASAGEVARAQRLLPHIGEALPMRPPARDVGFAAPLRVALRRWGHLA